MTEGAQFGPALENGGVLFRLWAPAANEVSLITDRRIAMSKEGNWFKAHLSGAHAGTRYRFRIDDDLEIPDPASCFQPEDVQGPSELVDHRAYTWQANEWRGLPWEQAVFLEAHVGCFTPNGTYRAMLDRLDHLAGTGITALELMPIADFPGRWNWGYDGVLLYAPDSSYGRPHDLKALIDAAHMRGVMVFLDVVYNHFGPEGNYLHRIAPQFFSSAHHTPWGSAIDYRVPEVRAFAIENALCWLRDYRFDGLRLDAVHAIVEPGEPHILEELAAAVRAFAAASGRNIHLVLENDDNASRFLMPRGGYRAQWNDDYHHAWHVLLTHERAGYYADYQQAAPRIARTLAEGFSYQGERSRHRKGRSRGEPSAQLPRSAFINFLQNHDQIGNRPLGQRLSVLADPNALDAALAVLLLQPGPPLMFMGDEWGARQPFPFFCDFKGELAEAVRAGRRREFAEAYAEHGDEIPDPLSAQTFAAAKIDWSDLQRSEHAQRHERTRALLALRRSEIEPLVGKMTAAGEARFVDGVLAGRCTGGPRTLLLAANLSTEEKETPRELAWGKPIWGGPLPARMPPWSVYAAIGDA